METANKEADNSNNTIPTTTLNSGTHTSNSANESEDSNNNNNSIKSIRDSLSTRKVSKKPELTGLYLTLRLKNVVGLSAGSDSSSGNSNNSSNNNNNSNDNRGRSQTLKSVINKRYAILSILFYPPICINYLTVETLVGSIQLCGRETSVTFGISFLSKER